MICFHRYLNKNDIASGQNKGGVSMEQKAEMAFKLMDRSVILTEMQQFRSNLTVLFRNNDGYITKQEMLNTTKKLSEKQVSFSPIFIDHF